MTPQMITAIAYLLTEALVSGAEITSIMAEVKATGRLSPEQLEGISSDVRKAVADWDAAPGPSDVG